MSVHSATASPQALPPQKKSHWVRWTFLVIIIGLAIVGWQMHKRRAAAATQMAARNANPPVPVIVGRAKQVDVPVYLDGLGTVQAFNTVTVHTRVDGELIKVAFTEGQNVKSGDVLAQIDPDPYRTVVEQAEAKKAQDSAQLANAKVDLKRYSDLLPTEGTTEQTYATQKALVDQLGATVKADQAALDSAQVNLNYATIHSPIDGRVGIRLVDQGNIVHATDTGGLVVLTQLKPISVVFTLPESALRQLHAGRSETNYSVLVVGQEETNVIATGQLAVIDNEIDTTTGTIKIKANFPNEDLRLWPGEFVNTRLLVTIRTNSIVVPATVVQRGPEGSYAFIVQDKDGSTNQTVAMRPITVGQTDNGLAVIEDGLTAGDEVVVDGQYKLQDGSVVQVSWATNSVGGAASGTMHRHHKKPAQSGDQTNQPAAAAQSPQS